MLTVIISHQIALKQLFCDLRNITPNNPSPLKPENLFVGTGSDEAIDSILRCFCKPGVDKILTCPPTYGMYGVSAQVNDLSVVKVPLDLETFALRTDLIKESLSQDDKIKVVYICSPGNPTANIQSHSDVREILAHPTWNGIVVVDEAYIDFAPLGSSCAEMVPQYPNLVVMQTLSKAFGLAGIRLGCAFADAKVTRLLNNLKAPYNVSSVTSALAIEALKPEGLKGMRENIAKIIQQRARLLSELKKIPQVGRIRGGTDSNFVLVEIIDETTGKPSNEIALKVYEGLASTKSIVVRFRGKEPGCLGCLRITVGTEEETSRFLEELEIYLKGVGPKKAVDSNKMLAANDVVA
jgi:histidinol-phosphate aminotransferase